MKVLARFDALAGRRALVTGASSSLGRGVGGAAAFLYPGSLAARS